PGGSASSALRPPSASSGLWPPSISSGLWPPSISPGLWPSSGRAPPMEEGGDAGKRLVDAFERVRVAEPQVALGVPPEVDTWSDRDVGLLEDLEGEGERVRRVAPRIGEDVEGAGGRRPHAEADADKTGAHRARALVEDPPETRGILARLAQRGERRPLDELVGGDEEIAVSGVQDPHELARSGEV